MKESLFQGDRMFITIENKSLRPIVIHKVSLIINGQYKLMVESYEKPLILDGFKATTIEMRPFSEIHDYDTNQPYDLSLSGKKMCLKIETGRGSLFSGYQLSFREVQKIKKNEGNLKLLTFYRKTYNGKILVPNIKYALLYTKDGVVETVFIHQNGIISEEIGGISRVDQSILHNSDAVSKMIADVLAPLEIPFTLKKVTY